MIAAAEDPDTSPAFQDRCVLRWAYRFRPRADERRARRAFDQVVDRHDSLRLRLRQDAGGTWGAEILPRHPTGLQVQTYEDMDPDRQMAVIEAVASAPMSALDSPLFEAHLLRFGASGDVLVLRAHHAIMDAYGSNLMKEDLLRLVLGLPAAARAISHLDALSLRARATRANEPQASEYWSREALPLPPIPAFGRAARGLPTRPQHRVAAAHLLEALVSEEEAQRLAQVAARAGATLFALVYTAFADVLCAEGGVDSVLLGNVYSGRLDPVLKGFVGPTMQIALRSVAAGPRHGLSDRARVTSQRLTEGADRLPSDAFTPGGAVDRAIAAEGRPFLQALVHAPEVMGHAASPKGLMGLKPDRNGILAFGPVSVSPIRLAPPMPTDSEIQASLVDTPQGPRIDLAADATAFDLDDLARIGQALRQTLGL